MTEPTDAATPAIRFEVVGGGTPTDEELAALVVGMTPGAAAPAGNGDELPGRPGQVPAWARAALLEGVGGRRPTRPSDLTAAAR